MSREGFNRDHQDGARCQQPPDAPRLCFNNCGFFGSPATMNLCSKCYEEFVRNEASKTDMAMKVEKTLNLTNAVPSPATSSEIEGKTLKPVDLVLPEAVTSKSEGKLVSDSSVVKAVEEAMAFDAVIASAASPSSSSKTGSSKCLSCKKRVGLLGFKCRCGGIYCSLHRYSDKHSCSFDYRTAAREAIAKANPVVKAQKIGKI